MLDGGGDVAGMKGFLVALEFLDGFGGDAELADRDRVGGGPRRGCGIGSGARANGGEGIVGIVGIEWGESVVDGGRRPTGAVPSLRVQVRSNEKREENKDRFFHVVTLTVSMNCG